MSALTKSWLQKQITDLEATRDEIPFGLDEDGNNTLAALKLALAGMEAEPAGEFYEDSPGDWYQISQGDRVPNNRRIPLYTAPQPLTTSERAELENYRNAQLVVPDCFLNSVVALESLYRNGQKQNWNERYTTDMAYASGVINACRAAMLQAGKSPVIPDGWVMMPVEPTAEMISSGIAAHYERSQIQIYERPAPGPMECAYVAMLSAAPQQEAE